MSTLTIEELNNFTPEKIFDFLNEDFLSEEGDSNPLYILTILSFALDSNKS